MVAVGVAAAQSIFALLLGAIMTSPFSTTALASGGLTIPRGLARVLTIAAIAQEFNWAAHLPMSDGF